MGLFRKGNKGIPQNATFRLTQNGSEKLSEFRGDATSRILAALDTNGSSNIQEIARNSGLSRGRVESMIPQLVRGGYVQHIGGSIIDED